MRIGMLAAVLGLLTGAAAAGEAAFTAGPTATVEPAGVRITFTVKEPIDAEVAILDDRGRVVRHLAAGMMAQRPLVPLRKSGDSIGRLSADADRTPGTLSPDFPAPASGPLTASLLWDRTDDHGRPVTGPVAVRVRLGLKPTMEKVLGFDGNALTGIVGLAVNARGEVFVLTAESTYGRTLMRVLDRSGKYLRTVMPYSAAVNAERAAPMGQLTLDGKPIPMVFNAHGHNLLPMNSGMKHQNMLVLPGGNLVFASAVGTIVEHAPMRHLLAIAPDGGTPDGMAFIGPEIRKPRGMLGGTGEGGSTFFDHLAASPDGKTIYYATWADSYAAKPRHVVYRLKWTDAELGAPFLGELDKPGDDDAHFNCPQGLAADATGRLYVCDQGNNRVMVFTADGKLAGKFSVPTPEQVAVHPKTGAIFIVSRQQGRRVNTYTLRAFSAFDGSTAKELASMDATASWAVLALDPSADEMRLWVAHRSELRPVTFDGTAFEAGPNVVTREGFQHPMFIAADGERGCAYVTEYKERLMRLDLASGELTTFKKGIEPFLDRDGNVYLLTGWEMYLERYDPKGEPVPFSALGTHRIGKLPFVAKGPAVGLRGQAVDRQGRIYLNEMGFYTIGNVAVYEPDGTKQAEPIIKRVIHGSSGLAIDPAGNIYLGSNLKPEGHPYPDSLAGQLPDEGWVWWRWTRVKDVQKREGFWQWPYYNAYLYHWGSVLKFPPTGGEYWGGMGKHELKKDDPPPPVAPEGTPRYKSGYLNLDVWVKGAEWVHRGMGPIPASGLNWGDPSCTCWTSRLAVDEYGRVFAPNVLTFSVDVLDTNGTPLCRVGRYGNPDDADAAAGPAWAWPAFVSYSAGKFYVSDPLNCRVTVVALDARMEKMVSVK